MKTWKKIILGAFALGIVILLLICLSYRESKPEIKTDIDSTQYYKALAAKNQQKADDCNNQLAAIENQQKAEDCNNQLVALEKELAELKKTKPIVIYLKDQRKDSAVEKPEQKTEQKVADQPDKSGIKNPENTSYPQRKQKVDNEVCFRLGGFEKRWIPQLAIESDEVFTNLKDNGYRSWNFIIPSVGLDSPSGQVGMLNNGKYFIAAELIDRYLEDSDNGVIESRSAWNSWQFKTMIKSGDYYIDK
jgi:hypothetical protein